MQKHAETPLASGPGRLHHVISASLYILQVGRWLLLSIAGMQIVEMLKCCGSCLLGGGNDTPPGPVQETQPWSACHPNKALCTTHITQICNTCIVNQNLGMPKFFLDPVKRTHDFCWLSCTPEKSRDRGRRRTASGARHQPTAKAYGAEPPS